MTHEQLEPFESVTDTEALSAIIQAEAIRDYDWVQDFSAQAEAMFYHAPPLEIWAAAVRAGDVGFITPDDMPD